jgi:RNA polymerase sigma-70 factor (ECF subfamily)
LYDRTVRPLHAYLRRISRDPALAEDLAQETYLRLLQSSNPASDATRLRAYLYRIATNLAHDAWRRRRRESRIGRITQQGSQAAGIDVNSLDLSKALECLKPRQRAMLWLAYVEGFEHREIAEILGVKETGIRVALFRCRKRLARALRREEPAREKRRASEKLRV